MASLAGASTASSSSSSIDLGRTRRIIATRLGQSTEFQGQAIFVKDAPSYLYNDDEPTGAASLTGRSSARISDPDTDLRLDALFKIILDVFTRDIATDNSLHLATRIKTDYKCLPFVGVGASYIVRKLDDVPVGSRGSGSIASSRVGEKFLAADLLRVKEKQRVSKQLRAMRTTRNPERSRRLLDATMTELCILTHHPLKMHDNILDFLGVMWEYDEVWRVWPVLILEYADMGTLAKCLASSEKFTFLQKMRICLDIGNGLDALHTCAVSHGDIKPDNIFVFRDATRGPTAKLGDFSISIIGAAMKSNPREALKMGGFTPLWVAPEHPEISTFARPMLLKDVISTAMPNKTLREPLSDVEMRVFKELPRPLLIQLRRRVEKASAQARSRPPMTTEPTPGWDPSEELHQSQWSSVIFRLQLENLGSWTLLETQARQGKAPWKVRLTHPEAAKFLGEDAQKHNPDKGLSQAVVEKIILGAVCDGSPDYSLERYAFSRNEKTSSAVRYLFRNEPVDIGETALAFSAAMALKHTDACSIDTLVHCLKMSNFTGVHSSMRQPDIPFSRRLDALQMLADTPMAEPTTDLANIFEQAMKNGIEPEMSDILPAHFLAALQGQGNARVSESLSSLSALISRLPELAEHIRTANPQELDRSLALLSACQFGNSAAARLLLAHGARGGVTNDRGLGPLHFLSSINPAEQSSIARELVAAGANPNGYHSGLGARDIVIPGHTEISSVSGSPLHHAVLHNDLGAVKTLIECGSTPLMANSKGNEFLTPLALAAALHCPETLKMLLDASDIRDISKWCDHFGNNLVCAALDSQWNTLRMGIHCGDFYAKTKETLKMLWDLRADFEDISFGWMLPALHYACKMASVNVVALLLEMGLRHQINKTDSAIHLPLHQALETGNEHLVLLLLDQGADISIHGRDDSYCLHQAIKSGTATEDATDNTVIFFVDLLLDRGANINELSMGRTPLYQAVAAGLYGVAGRLLTLGADMDAGLDQGLTMLGHLVQHEDQPMPALLSLLGPTHPFAPPGHLVGPDQLSALHLAAGAYKRPNPGSDATDVLEYLLLKFPNAEHLECAWGRWGLTPLMIAVITCNANAVKMLIEAGASVRTKASFGWSLASLVLRTLAIEALVRFRMAFLDTLGRYPDIGEPNLTFNNAVFSDITATIREYFLRPRPPPVRYPPGTSKASRSSRVQAFHELTRQQNLKISDISETRGGGDGRMYLKEADVDSNLGMLDVPNATLSELSLVLQEDLVRCPYIVHVSAYSWMRTEVRLPYRPVLLWQLFPNEVFVALSDHLHELRAMPFECGVYICSHVAAGLRAVHAAGFTHGRLDLDHVRIRNIIKKRASETILAGDKQPVTAQLWDFDYSSNVREDEAYHVYYQSERRTPFQAPELERRPAKSKVAERFETLKKYDAYALAILILCVLGGLDHERVLPRTGAYRDAAINAAVLRLVERSRPSKIGDAATVHLVPPLRKLLSEDPAGRPADVGEVAAALRTIQEVGNGKYILSA
ncbi:hypothetical protein ACJZ2D_014780 [Fusarium nematophilum]